MEYTDSCRWFSQVSWEEMKDKVDCLADPLQKDGEGYFLVLDGEQLKISFSEDLKGSESAKRIGKALKWGKSF